MIPTDCYVQSTLAILHNIRISQGYALAFMLILLQVSQTRKHFYASITCIRVRRPWVSLDQILCNCAECVAFDSLKHAVCEVDAWTGYNNAVFWHDHSDWFFHCCLAVIFEILIYISAQLFRVSFCPFDTSDFATSHSSFCYVRNRFGLSNEWHTVERMCMDCTLDLFEVL